MDKIVIFHAAAIGDTVLATPVSALLKRAFPQAKVVYVTHESLIPLLGAVPSIDESRGCNFGSIGAARQLIKSINPDLIVDLSGSRKSFWQTTRLAKRIIRYKKSPEKHAVLNFLETLSALGTLKTVGQPFPTLFPKEYDKENVRRMLARDERRLVALVPGVGSVRPHRAWPEDQWIGLAKEILWTEKHAVVLIGGSDERTLCSRIAEQSGKFCFNMAGKLTLNETAAVLSICDATVSGDTGPAHMSTAIGTPVIGIYGPTDVKRSGPYGMEQHALSATAKCKCLHLKTCPLTSGGPGACMKEISFKEVYANLAPIIKIQEAPTETTIREDEWGHLS